MGTGVYRQTAIAGERRLPAVVMLLFDRPCGQDEGHRALLHTREDSVVHIPLELGSVRFMAHIGRRCRELQTDRLACAHTKSFLPRAPDGPLTIAPAVL